MYYLDHGDDFTKIEIQYTLSKSRAFYVKNIKEKIENKGKGKKKIKHNCEETESLLSANLTLK